MVVRNDARRDPRVTKEASTLARAGYSVAVIGVTGEDEVGWEETAEGYRVRRVRLNRNLRRQIKQRLRSVSPATYGRVTRLYRRARGISEAPHGRPTTSPSAGALNERDRVHRSMIASLESHSATQLSLAQAIVTTAPTVVHAHDLDTLQAGVWAARMTGAALVFDSHEIWWQQHAPDQAPQEWIEFHRALEAELIGVPDRVITVCDSIADFFSTTHGIVKPAVVRNAIDIAPADLPTPDSLHPSNRPVEVLFHGGFAQYRGLEELLVAAESFVGARLVLRGFGSLEASLRNTVAERSLHGKVTFEPPVPMSEVVAAASRSDIGVIPYKPVCLNNRFSTPNKLFEYLSAGVAVAASDLPEIRRVVLGEDVGVVFDPEDPASIASAINDLAADPERVMGMRRRAITAVRERHNWAIESEQLLAIYRELLPRRPIDRLLSFVSR